MTDRLERIEEMLAEEPGDTFLRYCRAMELAKAGRDEESLAEFRGLTQATPPYVPAFFMAAQRLVDWDRVEEARDFLRTGIEEARRQGDGHAAAEMSEYLAMLGDYGE